MCICEKSLKQGQELHFFYLVEHYLVDIISKGGQFAIVFFKVTCDSWILFYDLRTKTKISIIKVFSYYKLKYIYKYLENLKGRTENNYPWPQYSEVITNCLLFTVMELGCKDTKDHERGWEIS